MEYTRGRMATRKSDERCIDGVCASPRSRGATGGRRRDGRAAARGLASHGYVVDDRRNSWQRGVRVRERLVEGERDEKGRRW